jgi:hypothetical protein
LIAAITASPILSFFGRKTMLVATTFACALFLFCTGIIYDVNPTSTILIVPVCLFLVSFQWGPGPICWIYMSEVMNDKGV